MRRVDPKVYTKKYYLSDCSGYEEFKQSAGSKLEPRFKEISQKYPKFKNKKVLDIGCGRGEMVFYALKKGAEEAIGIDYSKDAIKIAKNAQKKQSKEIKQHSKFFVSDAKKIKFRDKCFDVILIIEVLEHLYPEEQEEIFKELRRVLKDEGVIFFHTAPSKWFNDFTYKYWCYPVSSIIVKLWNKLFNKKYGNLVPPAEIRTESHKIMHVNEPDYFSLQGLIKKTGFKGEIFSTNVTIRKPNFSWKDDLYNLLVYFYPFSNYFPVNVLWGNDFYALLSKK